MSRRWRMRPLAGILTFLAVITPSSGLALANVTLVMQAPPGAPALNGLVRDHKGNPLADVIIFAAALASGLKIPAKTDAKGAFQIPALPPGSFHVTAQKQGYVTVGINTVLIVSQVGHLEFTLTPGCAVDLDTEAAGKGANRPISTTPRNAQVVGCQQAEAGGTGASAIQALQDKSIVGSQQANSSLQSPIVRGLDSSRVVVLLDGQRLNSASVPLPTTLIAPSQIESLEVLPGAGSTLNGSGAIGGTINIVTEKPRSVNRGHMLDLEVDGALYTNGLKRLGAPTIFYSNAWMGARIGTFFSRQKSYRGGGEEITKESVLEIGRLFTAFSNSPALYPIFALPKNAEIQNGASHSSGDTATLYFYPSPKHNIQYTQLNVYTRDIGNPFTGPPVTNLDQFTEFLKINKYSARYEGTKLVPWIARISAGFYGQKFTIANGQFNYAINPGSSFIQSTPPAANPFTGNLSTFTLGSYTLNKLSVTAYSPDVQATITPLKGLIITGGASYLSEDTDDDYASRVFNPTIDVPPPLFPVPDFLYQNRAAFFQAEYDRISWLKVSGGARVDNWKSKAQISSGTTVKDVDSTEMSRNLSAVFRAKNGLNVYVRWEKGFREPSIGERVRAPIIGGGGNNIFEPESAEDVEVGARMTHKSKYGQFSGSITYFHNHINNFYRGDALFRAPSATAAVAAAPISAAEASFVSEVLNLAAPTQTTPTQPNPNELNQVTFHGVESSFQVNIPLGRHGSLSPTGNMSWLYGRNDTPIAVQRALISAFYNRADLPVKLKGQIDDVPQGLVAPFQATYGARYADARGKFSLDYNLRYSARVTRVDPLTLISLPLRQNGPTAFYSSFKNLDPFTTQSIKATYTKSTERYKVTFAFTIDNLTNKLFWEHFTLSPSAGRSFTFGVATNFSDLLHRF